MESLCGLVEPKKEQSRSWLCIFASMIKRGGGKINGVCMGMAFVNGIERKDTPTAS